jgi:hypothetical protein
VSIVGDDTIERLTVGDVLGDWVVGDGIEGSCGF